MASPAVAWCGGLSSQLRWGAKFALKRPRGGSRAHAARPRSGGARLPPCTVEARSEGASPRSPAAGRSPRPPPAPGADPSRSGAAPESRRPPALGGGSVSPPAPSPGPPASYPRGPDTQPRRSLALPENSEPPAAGACERVSRRECGSLCPPGALHAPGSAGGETWRSGREQRLRRPAEGARAVLPRARERGRTRQWDGVAVGCCARPPPCPSSSAPHSGSLPAGHVGFTTAQNTRVCVCVCVSVGGRGWGVGDGGVRPAAGQKNEREGRRKF